MHKKTVHDPQGPRRTTKGRQTCKGHNLLGGAVVQPPESREACSIGQTGASLEFLGKQWATLCGAD